MGSPRGASPPMRMTASWSRSDRPPNTRLWGAPPSTPRRAPLRSLRFCAGLPTGCRRRIAGDRSAPARGRTRTVQPRHNRSPPSNRGNELVTAPRPRGGGARRRPLAGRNSERGALSRATVAARRPEGPPLTGLRARKKRLSKRSTARSVVRSKRLVNSSSSPDHPTYHLTTKAPYKGHPRKTISPRTSTHMLSFEDYASLFCAFERSCRRARQPRSRSPAWALARRCPASSDGARLQ